MILFYLVVVGSNSVPVPRGKCEGHVCSRGQLQWVIMMHGNA
jgi:hypothetical protein